MISELLVGGSSLKKIKVTHRGQQLFFQLVSDNNDVNHVFGSFYLVSSKPENLNCYIAQMEQT